MANFHNPNMAKYMTVPPERIASFQPLSEYPSMTAITISAVQGGALRPKPFLITTQAKRNLSSRSGIGGVLSAT